MTANREPEPQSLEVRPHCAAAARPVPALPTGLSAGRVRAILQTRSKWVNGTVLHYYFFDRDTDGENVLFSNGSTRFVSWVAPDAQRDAVRASFQAWKDFGLGLEFREVDERSEAEVRVGFMNTDGSWSYVGREILDYGSNDRTMNFGWDLTTAYGHTTALHEIGHTLGMPHEHQNPYAGITWNEDKVYEYFTGPPNNWSRDETFRNVLQKIPVSEVVGSTWDADSIMEYWFPEDLIITPAQYQQGLNPPGTVSALDKQYMLQWYPSLGAQAPPTLTASQSVALNLKAGEQVDFTLSPLGTRWYNIGTFGASDTVIVLFEDVNGQLRYVAGDDDSGQDRNASIDAKLFQGRHYVVRLRLYSSWKSGATSIMYW